MLYLAGIALGMFIFLSLIRAAIGPTAGDRVVAINTVCTKVIVLLSIIGVMSGQYFYVDVAIVYALISFLDAVGLSKYLETGRLF